jgi:hypothetical protein
MRLTIAMLLLATRAFGDDASFKFGDVTVVDPEGAVDANLVERTVDIDAIAKCPHKPVTSVLLWIVFDGGNAVASDAAGSGDRAFDACVAKVGKKAGLAAKSRVAASVRLDVVKERKGIGVTEALVGAHKMLLAISDSALNSDPADPNALSAKEIDDVIRQHASAPRVCFQTRLKEKPDLAGKVTISFTIDGSGSVTEARASHSLDAKVDDCILRQIMLLKFPAKGGAHVNYPFIFAKQ